MWVRRPKGAYSIHTHFHRRKGVYMLEILVLVHGILIRGIGPKVSCPKC